MNIRNLWPAFKARPGQVNFCSAGAGGMGQLNAEAMLMQYGVQAITSLQGSIATDHRRAGQRSAVAFDNLVIFLEASRPASSHRRGRARAPGPAPDVPTFGELNQPMLNQTSWTGIAAPQNVRGHPGRSVQGHPPGRDQPAMVKRLNDRAVIVPEDVKPAPSRR